MEIEHEAVRKLWLFLHGQIDHLQIRLPRIGKQHPSASIGIVVVTLYAWSGLSLLGLEMLVTPGDAMTQQGNQAWQRKIPHLWVVSGFIGKSPINGPFSIAMFDYWRVSTSKLSVRMLSGESSGSLGRYNRLTEPMAYLAITAGTL